MLPKNWNHPKQNFNLNSDVKKRFRGIQVNTSPMNPEELDNSKALFTSKPSELVTEIGMLDKIMEISICGGCYGTDSGHLDEIARFMKKNLQNR